MDSVPPNAVSDLEVMRIQLGRPLRAPTTPVHRCALHLPVVAEVPPVLDSGEPFPTLYWLCCPLARRRVSRIEAAGGVAAQEQRLRQSVTLQQAFATAQKRYVSLRDARLPASAPLRPSGGIGGARQGVKCLHAHYADHLVHQDNPVGAHVHAQLGDLNCTQPCVSTDAGVAQANPAWREPPLISAARSKRAQGEQP